MQIRVSNDSVEIEGYVNAIERKSKPLRSRMGQFVERICKGAFKRAIERNDNVRLLLNHDWSKNLGGTKDGNLELVEDNIGLKARAVIKDPETIKKARNGDLVGWSFGFMDVPDRVKQSIENGMTVRDVEDLDLYEVSILDRSRNPAYDGTLITVRSDSENIQYHGEAMIADSVEIEIRENPKEDDVPKQHEIVEKNIDYSKYEAIIAEMKGDITNV